MAGNSISKGLIFTFFITSVLACTAPIEKEAFERFTDFEGDEDQLAFSPDGSQMAFTVEINGNKDIYIKSIQGKLHHQIGTANKNESAPAWSPGSDKLAYAVSNDTIESIQIYDLVSKKVNTIAPKGVRCSKPSWSPNGSQLVFNGHDGQSIDIYLAESLSGQWEKLTDEPGTESNFGFSPDGQYVGYTKRGGPDEDLFAISLDGKQVINITQHADHEWYPHWSPKKDKVLFYSTWGDEMTEVWTVDFPDPKFTRISNHIVEDFGAVFSPNGEKVLYISKRDGTNDLYLFEFQTGLTKRLNISENLKKGWPKWSPDGKTIAYSTNLEETYLYQLDIASRKVNRLTKGQQMEELADISPNGQQVAFVSSGQGSESNILLYDTKTQEITPFISSYHYQTRPGFSNKTGKVAYIQGPGGSVKTNDIYAVSPGKMDTSRLTHSGGVRHFVWHPNDLEIIYAYDSSANYSYDLWKSDISTGKIEPLLKTTASMIPTSVSPDGSNVLFHEEAGDNSKIYRLGLGKDKSKIGLIAGWDAKYSPDGQRIVFVSKSNAEQQVDIYIMNQDASGVQRLTSDRYKESSPEWTVDGKAVIFSAQKGSKDIWLYRLDL